ncbi:MAG: hypothetical protein WBA64_12050 [Marinomonas sp.]|uniref:hypothetical protein n=1 Tax=Marinomonas sp. TaxID=1904862 RepID=UPI003C76EE68
MLTIQSELALFKKTGNSTHARCIAYELAKILDESNLNNISQLHEVTVGHASNGDVKSGLLWSVVALHEAKNRVLIDRLKEAESLNNVLVADINKWVAMAKSGAIIEAPELTVMEHTK